MSQLGRRIRVRAGSGCANGDPNQALFAATLAQNAGLNGRILLPSGAMGQCIIRDIQVSSEDGNIWEFWFWGNSLFQAPDGAPSGNGEAWRGSYAFAAAGLQIGGTGDYYASATLLDILYEDDDFATASGPLGQATSNQQIGSYLNVTLINRSAGAKTANAWFDVTFVLEPTLGHA